MKQRDIPLKSDLIAFLIGLLEHVKVAPSQIHLYEPAAYPWAKKKAALILKQLKSEGEK